MRTQKFKPQLTNAFFATVNHMFGGSSQLPTTVEHCFVVWTVLNDLITVPLNGCSQELGRVAEHLIDGSENTFVGWALNCRVCMLLKGAVIYKPFILGFFVCRDVSVSIPEQTKQIIYILYDDIGSEVNCMINREKAKPMENARQQWYGRCGIVTIWKQ